ncbi:MAG: tyrosine-type recombinase/integrase family protein [Clostridia bacterium]|nr:tyrosine-type recombinase/integrase family protein [Clostridia bacterium]
MTPQDEKDLQTILFLAGRILERQHLSDERSSPAPALIPFPSEHTRKEPTAQHNEKGVVLQFPDKLRALSGKEAKSAVVSSQTEISIIFSEEEISKMPKTFRKTFRTNKQTAHVRQKSNGTYEIRIQINGCRITASAKNLAVAKEKFIKRLREYDEKGAFLIKTRRALIPYTQEWLDTVKKPYIKANTYKMYEQIFNAYIKPRFDGRMIESLTPFEMQAFINGFVKEGKHRTAEKIALFLSAVLDYAVDDGIIERSPMKRIMLARYEEEHGQSLTREEEKTLVCAFLSSPDIYAQAYVFMLYTGIRRGELASVELSNGWVSVITGKQRKGVKEKRRRLPVCPMLAKHLNFIDVEKIKTLSPGVLTKHIKDFLPAHHLHDLRHTFITRAQECGIKRELVSLWAGHAPDSSITSTVYTHLEQNDAHQIASISLFSYDWE